MDFSIQFAGKCLGAANLFRVAKNACERLKGKPPASGGQDDALVSILFSAASIEAFFNELPEMLSSLPELLKDEPPQVSTFVRLADEIETNKGSIKLKCTLAYSVLSGTPCNKGGDPYQDLSLLLEARNLLMHMKPSDFSGEATPDGTVRKGPTPRTMERFRALGILDTSPLIMPFSNAESTQANVA